MPIGDSLKFEPLFSLAFVYVFLGRAQCEMFPDELICIKQILLVRIDLLG